MSINQNWELAQSIQLTPVRSGLREGDHGMILAERHPAGWFISARFDADLSADEVADFAQFVVVRTYLLLEQGPRSEAWDSEGDVWRAYCSPSTVDVEIPERLSA